MKTTALFGRRWLPRLTIRSRIIALVVVPLVGLATLGAAYFCADGRIAAAFDENLAYEAVLRQTDQLEISVLKMRRQEKDFLLRKDARHVQEFWKSATSAEQALDDIGREINRLNTLVSDSRTASLTGAIETLNTGLQGYK